MNTTFVFLAASLVCLALWLGGSTGLAAQTGQQDADSGRPEARTAEAAGDSLLLGKRDKRTASEVIQGRKPIDPEVLRNQPKGTTPPGPYSTAPWQDSAYRRALQIPISPRARFAAEASFAAANFQLPLASTSETPVDLARRHLDLPRDYFAPRPEEQVMHDINLANSAKMPGVGRPRLTETLTGLQIPLTTIGSILGFTKDVSPTMHYFVEYNTMVEVVIYSSNARVVTTLLQRTHLPGSYQITWNGRDENGKPMPRGDYVGEIRIGKESILRKHIQLR